MAKSRWTPASERFWYRVKRGPADACWMWIGGNNGRYGVLGRGRQGDGQIYAHRLSYEMHVGPIPVGLDVMHSCDEPLCVNPKHLSVGTRLENTADMVRKGRASHLARTPGEKNRHAKLTEVNVRAIRKAAADGTSVRDLMERFGLTDSAIRRVISRFTWKHVA
jgi:HNH endonuclease